MTRNVEQTSLDMLLGSVGTGGDQIFPEMGLKQNRLHCQPDLHRESSIPLPEQINERQDMISSSWLDASAQAKILLQPKSSTACKYCKIIDFVHSIIRQENEKILAEGGTAKLSVNYGYVKPKLEQVSIQQYVIGSIRILNCLIQNRQIGDESILQQYLAYLVKTMELATRYEWKSVLYYDDHFRQLQATYNIPWVFESHHMNTVRLIPLAKPVSGYGISRPECGYKKKYSTNSTHTASSSNFSSELHADCTADGRVICRMFNGTNGCTLFNCKFSHVCNLKLNGKACGQNHPSYKHGS